MKVAQVMSELEKLGSEQTKKTLLRHGVVEPLFGVKIGDLKPLQKKLNKEHSLALELYATKNSDAMYLAGLIADESKITKSELNRWSREATSPLIANSTVAALAAESAHALAQGNKWIEAKKELVASAGWSTLTHYLSLCPNEDIDQEHFAKLLDRVIQEIHDERNEVKAAMNGYIIAIGSYLPEMTAKAKAAAKKIGEVIIDHGDTACQTPDALAYIQKIEKMGRIGKKRKTARC